MFKTFLMIGSFGCCMLGYAADQSGYDPVTDITNLSWGKHYHEGRRSYARKEYSESEKISIIKSYVQDQRIILLEVEDESSENEPQDNVDAGTVQAKAIHPNESDQDVQDEEDPVTILSVKNKTNIFKNGEDLKVKVFPQSLQNNSFNGYKLYRVSIDAESSFSNPYWSIYELSSDEKKNERYYFGVEMQGITDN